MDLLSKVKEIKSEFADKKLKPLNDSVIERAKQFSKQDYWCSQASVNVHSVVGTMDMDYADNTWLNLFQHGKRIGTNLGLLKTNPNYYYETAEKTQMEFIKINDDIYIGRDGNHRTCIARFFFFYNNSIMLHGVSLQEYVIDEIFENTFNRLTGIIDEYRLPVTTRVCRNYIQEKTQ